MAHYELTLCLDDFPKIRAAHEAWEAETAVKRHREETVTARALSLSDQSAAVTLALTAFRDSQVALDAAQRAHDDAAARVESLKAACRVEAEAEQPFDEARLLALRSYIS